MNAVFIICNGSSKTYQDWQWKSQNIVLWMLFPFWGIVKLNVLTSFTVLCQCLASGAHVQGLAADAASGAPLAGGIDSDLCLGSVLAIVLQSNLGDFFVRP